MDAQATRLAALLAQGQQTPMTPSEESQYRLWVLMNGTPQTSDYNMRGFFKASQLGITGADGLPFNSSVNPNDGQMHFPDTFKLPSHRTFSTDSGYFDPRTMPNTPSWQGGPIGKTGAEAWTLRRPNGQVVETEAPWIRREGDR